MTYAQDCQQMRDRDRRRGLKRIDRHTDEELDEAIERARVRFGDDFWLMLHGIDAYQERRRRRGDRRKERYAARVKHDITWEDLSLEVDR